MSTLLLAGRYVIWLILSPILGYLLAVWLFSAFDPHRGQNAGAWVIGGVVAISVPVELLLAWALRLIPNRWGAVIAGMILLLLATPVTVMATGMFACAAFSDHPIDDNCFE
jgi:hypothetical protein